MTSKSPRFSAFRDDRGLLLPISLAEVPFPVRRLFLVTESIDQVVRGNHRVPCRQLLVLLSGSVSVTLTDDDWPQVGSVTTSLLTKPGDSLELTPGVTVQYSLTDEHSTVLVLAEEEFVQATPSSDPT